MENIVSEHSCKTLFYNGYKFENDINRVTKNDFCKEQFDKDKIYIAKVDCGIKSRKKNGLIKIGKINEIEIFINELNYDQFIIEPYYNITREDYVMFRYSESNLCDELYYGKGIGGINFCDIDKCDHYLLSFDTKNIQNFDIPEIINDLYLFYKKYHFTFLEINPLGFTSLNKYIPLDFAAKHDQDSLFLFSDTEKELLIY